MTTTSMQTPSFTFYATTEYYQQLCADIDATVSGDRILLATMAFEPEAPAIATVVAALCAAAKRGVRVRLSIDAYVFLVSHKFMPGPLLYRHHIPAKLPKALTAVGMALSDLQNAGVELAITNTPRHRGSMPFAGRSHAKISIINDTVYLGGCNLGEYHLDCMVRWQNGENDDWLYELF